MEDRELWCAAVHGVTKNWTWLSDQTTATWEKRSVSTLSTSLLQVSSEIAAREHQMTLLKMYVYTVNYICTHIISRFREGPVCLYVYVNTWIKFGKQKNMKKVPVRQYPRWHWCLNIFVSSLPDTFSELTCTEVFWLSVLCSFLSCII